MPQYNTSSLLVPRELVHEIASGAAEIIVEKHSCESSTAVTLSKSVNTTNSSKQGVEDDGRINRGFIHIFDEDERHEQLRLSSLPEELRTIHETKLRQLQWARSTLLADERVSAFLSSRSASMWPDVERLTEVVNVVRMLKEFTDIPPDPRGAARMQEAMQIVFNESRYSGVHTLISAPVAGELTVYENKKIELKSPLSHQRQQQSEYKANLTRDGTTSIHPVQWLLQISRNCYILPDVLRLPMTTKAQESLLELVHTSKSYETIAMEVKTVNNSSAKGHDKLQHNNQDRSDTTIEASTKKNLLLNEWLQIVALHRESLMRNNMALFYTIQDAVRTFQMTEKHLIELMERAAETNKKVRIRGGVYATVVHRLEAYIVLVHNNSNNSNNSSSIAATMMAKAPSENDRYRASDVKMSVLTNTERSAFYKLTRMEYDTAVEKGLVLLQVQDSGQDNTELEQTLRENFLSPTTCINYELLECNTNDNNSTEILRMVANEKDKHHPDSKETSTNHFFNSVSGRAKRECWRVLITSHPLSEQMSVKHIQCEYNPFIIVHGTRVDDGFHGQTEVLESLKRQRDAIAEEQTERVLRGEYNDLRERAHTSATELPSSLTTTEGHSRYAFAKHDELSIDEDTTLHKDVYSSKNASASSSIISQRPTISALSQEYYSSSITSDDDVLKELSRVVIGVLSEGPATRAELTRHPRLARWIHHVRFDALLKNVLKVHAEYRSRKYYLRESYFLQKVCNQMARGARSKKDTRFFHKHKHTLESNAQEVDPALMERFRSTRQPIRKSQLFSEILKQKKDTKRARREVRERERKVMKDKAPEKSIPKTKERLRQPDVTVIDNKEDGEIINDEADDEFASYFKSNGKPKILITTGEHPCYRTKQLMKELLWLFPNSTYRPRRSYSLQEITQFCVNREFTDLVVITDRIKQPYNMIISHLPEGPTATFRVSNFMAHADLDDPAPRTEHYPELIFKNFDTRLGRRIARLLECLFPLTRDYAGRAVSTFHNQRDYIFLRTHRYIFDNLNEVRLQEMGPRFTLRLLSLQSGTFDRQFGEYEWFRKKEHDVDKLEWYL